MLKAIPIIAASAALTIPSSPAYAGDDQWPCEVLLCISNPGGVTEFAACLPPIRKLINHLAALKPFPVCGAGGMSSARYTPPSKRNPDGFIDVRFADGTRKTYTIRALSGKSSRLIDRLPRGPAERTR